MYAVEARDVEGYDGVLVHGPLLGAWLMSLAKRWAEPFGEVTAIDYRSTSPVTVGQELTVTREVVGDGPEPAAEVWVALADGTRARHGRVAARRTA